MTAKLGMAPESITAITNAINAVWRDGGPPNIIYTTPSTVRWFARATMTKRRFRRWRGRMKGQPR